jgi:hypothetical protein
MAKLGDSITTPGHIGPRSHWAPVTLGPGHIGPPVTLGLRSYWASGHIGPPVTLGPGHIGPPVTWTDSAASQCEAKFVAQEGATALCTHPASIPLSILCRT